MYVLKTKEFSLLHTYISAAIFASHLISLKKQDVMVWTGFNWLMILSSDRLL
jgi:hypothetical protein